MTARQLEYIVMSSAARMPASCGGKYRRVAVVRVAPGFAGTPAMISPRAKGVAEIVETWERLNVGASERCAYRRAMAEAVALAATLNGGRAEVAE